MPTETEAQEIHYHAPSPRASERWGWGSNLARGSEISSYKPSMVSQKPGHRKVGGHSWYKRGRGKVNIEFKNKRVFHFRQQV